MEGEALLFAVAGISVSLAGFSGIVIALGGEQRRWSEEDRWGLAIVLLSSGAALFFALLPPVLELLLLPRAVVWSLTSGTLAILLFIVLVRFARLQRTTPTRHPVLFWTNVTCGVGIVGAQAFSAWSIGLPQGAGVLAVGLIWLLFMAFVQLSVLLGHIWSGEQQDSSH